MCYRWEISKLVKMLHCPHKADVIDSFSRLALVSIIIIVLQDGCSE